MSLIVETRAGRLQGVEADGVHSFLGIPFARPPVGERRFRAPEPAEPWSGVRDAGAFGPIAPQPERQVQLIEGVEMGERSEDCLYLNLYTPAADAGRRPVMVWIHGGGFQSGSGASPMYDGAGLARRGDAVVVTINYRLGALGFIDLRTCGGEQLGAACNPGLLDQVLALRWVRDNAPAFGGDPDNVTIFGESAGGMSVGALLGTPAARGLFRRAIAQSGAAHHVHTPETAAKVAEIVLDEAGVSGDAARLRELPADELVAAQARALPRLRDAGTLGLSWAPVLDPETLPEPPLEVVRNGGAAGVSLLVGTTRDEWNLFRLMDPRNQTLDREGALKRTAARLPGPGARAAAARMLERYRAARRERQLGTEPIDLFTAIETDRMFRVPAIRLAEAQRPHQPQTFQYLFCWESPLLEGRIGSCHALELPFVFGTLRRPALARFAGSGPTAEALSDRMMDAWLAFARGGDPGHADLPEWPAYDAERRAVMIFDRDCKLERAPFDAERRAWDGLL